MPVSPTPSFPQLREPRPSSPGPGASPAVPPPTLPRLPLAAAHASRRSPGRPAERTYPRGPAGGVPRGVGAHEPHRRWQQEEEQGDRLSGASLPSRSAHGLLRGPAEHQDPRRGSDASGSCARAWARSSCRGPGQRHAGPGRGAGEVGCRGRGSAPPGPEEGARGSGGCHRAGATARADAAGPSPARRRCRRGHSGLACLPAPPAPSVRPALCSPQPACTWCKQRRSADGLRADWLSGGLLPSRRAPPAQGPPSPFPPHWPLPPPPPGSAACRAPSVAAQQRRRTAVSGGRAPCAAAAAESDRPPRFVRGTTGCGGFGGAEHTAVSQRKTNQK